MASQSSLIVTASGLAAAVTTILNEQILPILHSLPMTLNVQQAYIVVLTALFGHYISLRNNDPNLTLFLKKKDDIKQFCQIFNYFKKN